MTNPMAVTSPSVNLANALAPRRALPEKTRQVKAWIRALYGLGDEVVVSVTQLTCRDEGCADIETVIGIMRPGEKPKTVRIHKPLAEIGRQDLLQAAIGQE